MSILSGIKKVIPYFKNADGNYEQLSYKTSSQTVDFDDGKTAETKLGAINGITKSLNSTSDSVAISASAGKSLQDQITTLNSNIASKLDLGNFKVEYISNVSDCNNMFRGIFTTNTAANRPSNNWCAILSMPINDKFNLQIGMVLGSTDLYVRSSNNGIYLAWRKI